MSKEGIFVSREFLDIFVDEIAVQLTLACNVQMYEKARAIHHNYVLLSELIDCTMISMGKVALYDVCNDSQKKILRAMITFRADILTNKLGRAKAPIDFDIERLIVKEESMVSAYGVTKRSKPMPTPPSMHRDIDGADAYVTKSVAESIASYGVTRESAMESLMPPPSTPMPPPPMPPPSMHSDAVNYMEALVSKLPPVPCPSTTMDEFPPTAEEGGPSHFKYHSGMVSDVPLHFTFSPNEINEESMKITKPIMVGSINILEASDDTLVRLIRQAKNQIEQDKDMAIMSSKFQEKKKELNKVIKLCIKQLDGESDEKVDEAQVGS